MKQSEYTKIIDALNVIDEHATRNAENWKDEKEIERSYTIVADFINKKASKK